METKICNKCHIEKPINEFLFRKDRNKYRNECKKCQTEYHREYRKTHSEELKTTWSIYRKKNKEKISKYFSLWNQKHKNLNDEIYKKQQEYKKTYRKENKEKIKNYRKKNDKNYREKHKEEIREMHKNWEKIKMRLTIKNKFVIINMWSTHSKCRPSSVDSLKSSV